MPQITRLVQSKKNPNRVNLYLDGSYSFSLSLDEIGRHNLKIGVELDDSMIASLKESDDFSYIYSKILNYISFRPRTEKEIRNQLAQYKARDIETVITKLKDHNHLDNYAFAKWFINSRDTFKHRSTKMLVQELRSKGLSNEIISSTLSQFRDEKPIIRSILEKKLRDTHKLDFTQRQKIFALLSRQGFAWEVIKEVVKTWESE